MLTFGAHAGQVADLVGHHLYLIHSALAAKCVWLQEPGLVCDRKITGDTQHCHTCSFQIKVPCVLLTWVWMDIRLGIIGRTVQGFRRDTA